MYKVFLTLFALATVMCVMIAMHAFGYVILGADMMPPLPPDVPELARVELDTPIGHYRDLITGGLAPVLYVHAGGGAIALLLAPVLIFTSWLRLSPTVHQYARDIYALSAFLSAAAGMLLALMAWGGGFSRAGFFLMGVTWMVTVVKLVRAVTAGDEDAYDVWLLRSLAVAFGGVMLRVWVPLLLLAGLPFAGAYGFAAWWCWVPNLFALELWISGRPDAVHGLARAR